jgi:hypothetical protein
VTYSAVLSTVPGLHANPPRLPGRRHVPDLEEDSVTPFDFILHVGVAGRGGLRVEKKGHKYGYNKPGSDGELCPVAQGQTRGFGERYEELQEELYTSVDIDAIVDHLNQMGHKVGVLVISDLCSLNLMNTVISTGYFCIRRCGSLPLRFYLLCLTSGEHQDGWETCNVLALSARRRASRDARSDTGDP